MSEGITRVLKVLREFDASHIGNLLFQAVSIHIKMSNDLCMIMYVHMVLFFRETLVFRSIFISLEAAFD